MSILEAEEVWLSSPTRGTMWHLADALRRSGFKQRDEVFTIDRSGRHPIWQSRTVVGVYVYDGGDEAYFGTSPSWNRVCLKYHLARVPSHFIDPFVDHSFRLGTSLGLPLLYNERPQTPDSLRELLLNNAAQLTATVAEPGSKQLAIAIELQYQR